MSSSKKKYVGKIPRNTEWGRAIESQLCNSHILEELVFPEARDHSPYEITKSIVESMEQEDVKKEHIYAFIKTGRMLSNANVKYASLEEKRKWTEAIKQYEKLVKSGTIQPSDSLVPFIQDSKEVENPRKSRAELEHLFDIRHFHEAVVGASRNQFVKYDLSDSVFNAYRKLLVTIQENSGNFREDGIRLIASVFSSKSPVLQSPLARLNEDTSIQDGIMYLFMGAVLCIRNVFAHKEIYLTDVDHALDYLSFSSFLFKILDAMERTQDDSTAKRNKN
jgi:uncharacterized protein (TIGR02391 family)